MNSPTKSSILLPFIILIFTHCLAHPAFGELLVAKGQRAVLTVSVMVDGKVEKPQGHRDEVVKWSTKRSFEATVEMVADKAEKQSISANFSGPSDSQRAALEDIQKQAQACGNNQLCQMRVAMQMMNSQAMAGASKGAPRYQVWRALEKGGNLFKVTGTHTEDLHTVFYTAARETTNCVMTAPKVSPELIKMDPTSEDRWAAMNKETLESSARSFTVEVDGVDKVGMLVILSPLSVGSGNIECVQNIGSGPETSQHSKSATLLPTEELKLPLKVSGSASEGDVIASGLNTLKVDQKLNNLGVGFAVDVAAPLEITIRWELKRL